MYLRETTTVKDRAGNDVLIYKDEAHKYAEWNKPKAAPKPKPKPAAK